MSQKEEQLERKRRAMELMAAGVSWKEANEQCDLTYTRRGIQKLYQRWLKGGDEALIDHRHGHPYKATEKVREWMKESCPEDPDVHSVQVASDIEAMVSAEPPPTKGRAGLVPTLPRRRRDDWPVYHSFLHQASRAGHWQMRRVRGYRQ